jgi:hypothetical protein
MSRASIPEDQRQDFALYVDEFQNFSTDSFATILSEARKYRLNLIVANQFTTQLTEEIRDAVFGNVGTIVSFRVGQDEDAEALAKRYRPAFDTSDLLRVPNYNTIVRTLIGGVPTQPFSMATLPAQGQPNKQIAEALKQLSAAKYGRPRADVEKEIFGRLATQTPPAPAAGASGTPGAGTGGTFGSQPPGGFSTGTQAPPPKPPAAPGAFLDEWMTKRSGPLTMRPSPWSKKPAPASPGGVPATPPNTAAPATPQAAPLTAPPTQSPNPPTTFDTDGHTVHIDRK